MSKCIFIATCIMLSVGCTGTVLDQKGITMLSVENIVVSKECLKFEYKIKNTFVSPIWICEDIYEYYDIKAETKVTSDNLVISLKSFDVPETILLESPILAKYTRLDPNNLYEGELSLKLPICSRSPLNLVGGDKTKTMKVLHRFVLEVGYFNENLYLEASDSIEKSDSNDTVHIGHLWGKKNKEQILKVEVEDVNIPCLF